MQPAPFDYHRPDSLAEALELLGSVDDARPLAGGQSLLPMMKMRMASPATLVDLGRIAELSGVDPDGETFVPLEGDREMTPAEEQHHVEGFGSRGDVYGMPSETVDGMDVGEVYDAASRAVERAREGEGPSLLICETYRYRGHYEGDPTRYRTEEEVERWQERDPISTLAAAVVEADDIDENEVESMREDARERVEAAVEPGLAVAIIPAMKQIQLAALILAGNLRMFDILNQPPEPLVLGVDVRSLISARQKRRLPVLGILDRQSARAHGHEAGEVLILGSQPV